MIISVVIPCFNCESTIERCVNSVFRQNFRNLEIICINDGSKDLTLKKITHLKDASPFPFHIIDQENGGACAARNKGIAAAKGEYIQFLDADDELKENKIDHQLSLLKGSPDILIAALTVIFPDGRELIVFPDISGKWKALIQGKAGCTCSNLFKKSMLQKIGGWNEAYKSSQETELMFRIFQHTDQINYDDDSNTIIHKQLSGSISNSNIHDNWIRYVDLRILIWEYIEQHDLDTEELTAVFKINIFNTVRILYELNKEAAIKIHNKYFKKKYKPVFPSSLPRKYIMIYNLFGFEIAQQMSNFFKR